MFKPFLATTLTLDLRVSFSLLSPFEPFKATLELRDAGPKLSEVLLVGRTQLADGLREPGAGLLTAPRDLLASDLPATDDVVDEALGTLSGPGRRVGGHGEGALDRGTKRFADPLCGGVRVIRGGLVRGLLHSSKLR